MTVVSGSRFLTPRRAAEFAGYNTPMVGDDSYNSLKRQSFATTRWSMVVGAASVDSAQSREACAALCSMYWYPLYAFVRRSGHGPADAEDLTQGFFACFLERSDFAAADPKRGKFRSFLLAAMKHFLSNQRDRELAQKRGGGRQPLPLDFPMGERRYQNDPTYELTADKLFEQQWALALLERVLDLLSQQYAEAGKQRLFEALKSCITQGRREPGYGLLAADLGMTEEAVKVAAHRLRQRYRKRLRQEIAETVSSSEGIEDEIRDLFAAFQT